jgi:hypothetical protein
LFQVNCEPVGQVSTDRRELETSYVDTILDFSTQRQRFKVSQVSKPLRTIASRVFVSSLGVQVDEAEAILILLYTTAT